MAKSLDTLKLVQLIEMHNAVEMLCQNYAKELTTYAEMQSDRMFQNVGINEKNKIETHRKYSELDEKIKNKIAERINEYCE